ncbi:MAG: hypothetical protein N2260_00545 [Syntrophobacterales bacterium]|nr:hypothetical protein [Syntrophobacterales bacterium]
MSHHDVSYRVSGINRELLKKLGILGSIVVIVAVVVFLAIPTRYYFCLKNGYLGLYVGRIGWFDALKDKGFKPVYFGKEKDPQLQELLSQRFKTREEALQALVPIALHRIHRHIGALYEVEKSLYEQYQILLGEYLAAHQAGIKGFELPIEALQSWLDMYKERDNFRKLCEQGGVKVGTPKSSN